MATYIPYAILYGAMTGLQRVPCMLSSSKAVSTFSALRAIVKLS
jgi:hypothetical protein